MKLGVDFGTTRVVVASADRGNYPLVDFEAPDGHIRDWFPPLVALHGGERLFGWEASAVVGDPDWTVIRSIKRLLKTAGPKTEVVSDSHSHPVTELLSGLVSSLRNSLLSNSTLRAERGEPLEVMIGVPANANSNQRFLTAEAFREAGFSVLGMLNEPSAASFEFGHRDHASRRGQPVRRLLVYDLGGGTFDASLVETEDDTHTVIATTGVPELGGDDFDEILAEMALEKAEIPEDERSALSGSELFRLYDECRERKEALNPNTRRIVVDLDRARAGWSAASVTATEFYERCRPLIERTEEAVSELLASHPERPIDTLYVTGGGSELPAVSRVLKETFGRRVKRSSYMRSATAIGLAIAADARSGYRLRDRFSQYFGVWREAEAGHRIAFDLLFPRGLELPRPGSEPVSVFRSYKPAHNIGRFRFAECSHLGEDGQPTGDLTLWDEIYFPFDPALREIADLDMVPVVASAGASSQYIEERFSCDASGLVHVRIENKSAGYAREYSLGRWSSRRDQRVSAGRVRARRGRGAS